ncbi:MAG: hypothetical protein ACYC7E_19600 [Armatimonadota bacterium]
MSRKLMLLVLVGLGAAAVALPSFHAASGYVQLPNAAVQSLGVSATVGYQRADGVNALSGLGVALPCEGDLLHGRAVVGLGSAELGAGYLTISKAYGDAQALTFSGKLRVLNVPLADVGVSLGASYRQWESDLAMPSGGDTLLIDLPNVTTAYVALDKKWATPVTGGWYCITTVGASLEWFTATQQAWESGVPFFVVPPGWPVSDEGRVDSAQFIRPFAGIEAGNGTWTILAEYRPEQEQDGLIYSSDVLSIALRRSLGAGASFTVGATNYNIPYTDADISYFADLSFHFGL